MPSAPPDAHISLRNGMHDLRNVFNAVQINAFAAREVLDDATRTLACIARIEAAVQRGTHVLQGLPAEETLAAAATALRERLHDAGGGTEVRCEGDARAPVTGLMRQALCLIGVESQVRGARTCVLTAPDPAHGAALQCNIEGLSTPGPIAIALGTTDVPELKLSMAPRIDGWTFRWIVRTIATSGT